MTTVSPVVALAVPASGAASLLVVAAPEKVAALPVGSRLAGHILKAAPDGLTQVGTRHGVVVAKTDLALPPGRAVTLAIQQTAPALRVRIDAFAPAPRTDSVKVSGAAQGALRPPNAPKVASAARSDAHTASLGTAQVALAKTLTPAVWNDGSSLRALPAAASLNVRIEVLPASSTPDSGTPGAGSSQLTLSPGQSVMGIAERGHADARSIVRLPTGRLALQTAAPLEEGQAVLVRPLSLAEPALSSAAGPRTDAHKPVLEPSAVWATLDDAVARVAAADPGIARSTLSRSVPRPEANLAATLLLSLKTLSGGDVTGWMGDAATRLLQRQNPQLSSRLADEFRDLARTGEPQSPADWRTLTAPFLTPEGWQTLRVHSRGHRGRETSDSDVTEDAARFVVDIRLSRLGRLQLDGLLPAGTERLDLLVRSETALPKDVRDRIRTIFAEARTAAGLQGSIGFRAAPPQFVEAESKPPMPGTGVLI